MLTSADARKLKNVTSLIVAGLFLVSCSSNGAQPTPTALASYSLDWKLADGEVLAYRTAMNQAAGTDSTLSFNFGTPAADSAIPSEVLQQLSNLTMPQTSSMISLLKRNSNGNIGVRMIVDQVSSAETQPGDSLSAGLNQFMQRMVGTVQLRGEVTPDGGIASFYLEETQRNLLAIFFELPIGPVHVGDTWGNDLNCISLGSGYISDQSVRINQVQFSALSQTSDGRPVAVLDYILAETVSGSFDSGSSSATPTPVSMSCSFMGQGRFLINEGRWEQFVGDFSIQSTGLMVTNSGQHFALMPTTDIPAEYLNLQ